MARVGAFCMESDGLNPEVVRSNRTRAAFSPNGGQMRPVTKIAIGVIAAALCWSIAVPLLHAAPDAGAAVAVVVPDPDQDTLGFLKWSFAAIKSGQFTIVASALVML